MLKGYFNIIGIAEWCCFIASLLLLDKKTTYWRLFQLFLFITISVETIGWYMNYIIRLPTNALPFNFLMLTRIVFFIWLFTQPKEMQMVKAKLLFLILLFGIVGLTNLFFLQKFWIYNSYTEIAGDILLMVVSAYFLFSVLKAPEYKNLFGYEYFWLANGLIVSSMGSMLLYYFGDSLYAYYKETKIPVYDYINSVLNVVLYGSLIIGFICRRKTTRSSPVLL
jgi:hypothetical protein